MNVALPKKMMVAFKDKELYWFKPEPYIQSQRKIKSVSSVECSEVLTMGCWYI
jgi:hypothetical protein